MCPSVTDGRWHPRTMRRSMSWIVCIAFVTACSPAPGPPTAAPVPTGSASPSGSANRPPTEPDRVIVENIALGASKGFAARAIRDLKKLGFWDDLTDHLFIIQVASRDGRTNIPEDGHLADAFLTGQVDERGSGGRCDIMFFTSAMADDLVRWERYYDQGLLPEPPPTWRQFWASILAHELAHCLRHGTGGEPLSEEYERKVLLRAREEL